MSIIKVNNDKIECPEGPHNAVLAAVYPLGLQPAFKDEKPKHKHAYVFELGEKIPNGSYAGEPYLISGIFTDSLHEKSRLFSVVCALKGGLTDKEVESGDFDTDSLIGLGCTVITANTTNAGKTTSTIVSFLKRDGAMPLLTPTFDRSKVPNWVKRLQDQRLDKPESSDNAT